MKTIYKIIAISMFGLFGLLAHQANATHFAGADFNYQCIGPNTYLVTFNLFRDCSGAGAPTAAPVTFSSPCGADINVNLTLQNGPIGTEVSQLCAASIGNSTCNGGPLPGMQQYIYSDIVVLNPVCNSWTMSWSSCCRNSSQNLVGQSGFWIPASINSAADSCNNSPVFNAQPIPYVCLNQLVNYNFGVVEPDGDSIVYSMVSPISSSNAGVNTNVTYNAGFTPALPIPGAVLNGNTGQLVFTPTNLGSYVVAVQVCEYEYGTGILLGCVTRDIQFVVISCSNLPPVYQGYQNFTGSGILVDSTTIEVCVGNTFSFDLEFPDPDTLDTVTLFSNIASVLPGAIIVFTPGNPAIMNVTWTTQSGTPPFNSFSVTAVDDACPLFGLVSASYVIKVTASTYAGPDQAICEGIQWAQLRGSGGTIFNWTVLSGSPIDTVTSSANFNMTCQNCLDPQVSPQTTTTYLLTSNLSTTCQNTDTVTITAAPNYIASSGPDTITCSVDSMQLWANSSLPGAYTYKWNNILRLSSDTVQNPKALAPITTTYSVTMTSSGGCIKSTTHIVAKVPPIPVPTIIADPLNICQFGDSSDLLLDLGPNFTTTCVESTAPCGNQGYTTDILLDYNPVDATSGPIVTLTNTEYPAPFGNAFKTAKQQYLYLGRELTAMGLQAGLITELGFFVTAINGTSAYYNYSMKIGCTTKLSMPGTLFETIGLINVFPAQQVNITTGWNMLQFAVPYVWDGSSNLIVEICFDNRAQGATQNTFTRTREYKALTPGAQKFLATLELPSDTSEACTIPLGYGGGTFFRPDTRFTFCYGYDPAAYEYTWWPNLNINDTSIQGPTVWPDTTTTYNVILADTFGVCADTTSIEISVANFVAGPDTTICGGDTIQLSPEVFDLCTGNPPFVYWYSNTGVGLVSLNGLVPTISVDTTTIFHVTYTNFCGCSVQDSVTVFVNKMYEPNLVFTEPACGMSDGEILVNSNGGASPFLFSADGGQSFQIDSLFTSLPMGPYTTQYMDSNGCLSPTRIDTLINFNTPTIDSVITNTPLCFSTASGVIDIYITGGQTPHSYSIDGGVTWGPNSSYNNVAAGTYVVFARDFNLCTSWPDTVTLFSNNQLLLDSVTFTTLICFQDSSGTIDVFGQGGTPPYSYSIDSGTVYQNNNQFSTLKADTYQVVIMDSVGCTTPPFEQIVQDAPEMIANIVPVNDTCFNACGGSSSVSIIGGTLPYSFNWRKGVNIIGSNSSNVNGLCAGSDYELTVMDSNNCQQIFPFTITQPVEVIASVIVQNCSCFGINDGVINVSAIGGIPPYRYSVNNGTSFSTNPNFTGLASGTYSVMVADSARRCFGTTTAIIIEPMEIELTTNISNLQVCISGCVPLIATAVGGSGGPYSYIWNNGFDSNATQMACPNQTTIYSVYAVDSSGCSSSAKLITLTMYDSLEVNAGLDADICPEVTTQLNAIAVGGNGQGLSYQWSPVFGLSNAFIQNPGAQPLVSTLYTVKVTDNCETPPAYDSVWVNVHPNPTMDFYTNDTASGCEPFNITLINASSPVQLAKWTITDSEESFTAHGFQVDLTDLTAGLYDVSLTVITPNGCESDITKTEFIEVFPKPTAIFSMDPEQTTIYNTIVQFEDKSIGNVQNWQWDFTGVGNSSDQNPLFKFPADTGTFAVTLNITTDKLCIDDVTELLRIGGEYNIYVPNSFTPNGDGQNDVFAPRGIGLDESQYSLQIYDRWGGLVFESNDLTQPWDGRHQGTSNIAQNGVYVWKIVAHDVTDDSNGHDYNGTVTLIR
ncbi:MAG: gliding motility-associated-like protein [Salibacteraceae bacterium]|jgi:gliding motility-associated-like protein